MSWASKYLFDPIKAAIANPTSPEGALATAALTNAQSTVTTALGEVNPLLDDATTGLEGLLDTFLSKYGALGAAGAATGDFALTTASGILKGIIDSKLGIPAS